MTQDREYHRPVMADETVELLGPVPPGVVIDATFGGGGHSRRLLEVLSSDHRVLGIDRDPEAVARASNEGGRLQVVRGNFANLARILEEASVEAPVGVLFDFGVSSHHLDDPARGFSYRHGGPLDMRMDPDQDLTASDLVNRLDLTELAALIKELGEEPMASRIAGAIVKARPISDHGPAGRGDCISSTAFANPRDRATTTSPGPSHLPSAPHRRQFRVGSGGERRRSGARGSCSRGKSGRDLVPLARRPDRQATLRHCSVRMHLPARSADLRLRSLAEVPQPDPGCGQALTGRSGGQPPRPLRPPAGIGAGGGMTARALRSPRPTPGLRVVTGQRKKRQPIAPWLIFSLVAVVAFLGMILTRTSLDRVAIELSTVEADLAEAKGLNQRLRLQIAQLESPARVAPAAQDLGMVYPQSSNRLVVEGVIAETVADPRWAEMNRFAAPSVDVTATESVDP